MDPRTQPTQPAWAKTYLQLDAWTQDELRNLLCGLPPVPPDGAPAQTRQEINDAFARDEVRRVVADRHVRAAILAGHLTVFEQPDERTARKGLTSRHPERARGAQARDHARADMRQGVLRRADPHDPMGDVEAELVSGLPVHRGRTATLPRRQRLTSSAR